MDRPVGDHRRATGTQKYQNMMIPNARHVQRPAPCALAGDAYRTKWPVDRRTEGKKKKKKVNDLPRKPPTKRGRAPGRSQSGESS